MYDSTSNSHLGDKEPFSRQFVSADLAVDVRHGFVKKVFCILGIQLVVTTAIASPFVAIDSHVMKDWLAAHVWVYILAIATTLSCCMVLCCCSGFDRKLEIQKRFNLFKTSNFKFYFFGNQNMSDQSLMFNVVIYLG